jgi:hypothetical protein
MNPRIEPITQNTGDLLDVLVTPEGERIALHPRMATFGEPVRKSLADWPDFVQRFLEGTDIDLEHPMEVAVARYEFQSGRAAAFWKALQDARRTGAPLIFVYSPDSYELHDSGVRQHHTGSDFQV